MGTYNSEGVVRLWTLAGVELKMFSELKFGTNVLEALRINVISADYAFLYLGGYDSKIHIYSIELNTLEAEFQASLGGHTNSIRDFAFAEGLTASCS